MQFIDQSSAYNRKSISLQQAIATERATLNADPDADKLVICFRPELKIAIAFDHDIDERVNFNDLPTPDKLDLLIDDLLPKFFHPDLLRLSGREEWYVRFLVDGSVERTLHLDDRGLHDVSGTDVTPAIELETDVVTLLAILRAVIADFHLRRPPYPSLPGSDDDEEVSGS
ncbi:hypothetical protein ACXYMO_04090 [Arenibacterium sp. CAU 1754]